MQVDFCLLSQQPPFFAHSSLRDGYALASRLVDSRGSKVKVMCLSSAGFCRCSQTVSGLSLRPVAIQRVFVTTARVLSKEPKLFLVARKLSGIILESTASCLLITLMLKKGDTDCMNCSSLISVCPYHVTSAREVSLSNCIIFYYRTPHISWCPL